jgi:hypothetical protein
LALKGTNLTDLHFALQTKIEVYYRERDTDLNALTIAIQACEQQIAIAQNVATHFKRTLFKDQLPMHVGYTQLIIILKKQEDYRRAITLCEQAKEQGWNGDWDKKIEELKKKEEKKLRI